MDDERLSGNLQENVLTLLCFDDKHCQIARAAITPQLFESSVYKEVAGHAIDFIDQYGEAIKEHLPDHLESILHGDDARKAKTYERLLTNLFQARDSINADYVISQLQNFVRAQTFKSALVKAVEAMEDGRIDAAELAMQEGMRNQVVAFDPGLNFSDADQMTALLNEDLEEPGFDLGIAGFDNFGIKPRKKEALVFLGPRGRGKSWFCVHGAKMALVQRWSVLIVTLEMSQKRYAARMLQSFFSLSKREGLTRVARLIQDRRGDLQDIVYEEIERLSLNNPDQRQKMKSRIKREFRKRKPLIIKQFPTQGLTIEAYRAYLDSLARHHNFVPDAVFLDYPDLMQHDVKNKRLELGALVEALRGEAVSRNHALIIPSQGNRESETARTVTPDQMAEDISKLATADTVITYSQTPEEKRLGLARLFAGKARNDEDRFSVLITQAYNIGQFCLESILLPDEYWDMVGNQQDGRSKRRHDDDDDAD